MSQGTLLHKLKAIYVIEASAKAEAFFLNLFNKITLKMEVINLKTRKMMIKNTSKKMRMCCMSCDHSKLNN